MQALAGDHLPATSAGITIPAPEELPGLYRQAMRGSSDQVTAAVDAIAALILEGRLAPGQRLIEPDISDELGIARGRVREALRILSGNGMIELIPNRGARVCTMETGDFDQIMQALGGVVLMGIEVFGRVHGRPSPEIAAALRGARDRLVTAASEDIFALPARQHEFHVLINHLTGNRHFNMLVSKLNIPFYESALARMHHPASIAASIREYHDAAELIIDDQAPLAASRLKQMLLWFIDTHNGRAPPDEPPVIV